MFFRQCGDCNQRWELGTKSTCACEARLEPMVWMNKHGACISAVLRAVEAGAKEEYTVPLYTNSPAAQRQWVGLTEEKIKTTWSQLWRDINQMKLAPNDRPQKETVGFLFARAIEAKLKELNHG